MKKVLLLLAVFAVSIIPASAQLLGTPSPANVTITGVDETAGTSCLPGGQLHINVYGGNNWLCAGPTGITVTQGVASAPFTYVWTLLNGGGKGFNGGIGPAIASATTIAPTYSTQHITGTTAIVNITAPATISNNAKIVLIFDAVSSWTAAGNIKAASPTIVAGQAYEFVYDTGTSFWYPIF